MKRTMIVIALWACMLGTVTVEARSIGRRLDVRPTRTHRTEYRRHAVVEHRHTAIDRRGRDSVRRPLIRGSKVGTGHAVQQRGRYRHDYRHYRYRYQRAAGVLVIGSSLPTPDASP